MALSVTKENIEELLGMDKPMVIDFWAEWCGPCRMIGPIVEELAEEYKDRVTVGKCNIEDNDTLAVQYSVRNIPTIIFVKNGEVVYRQVGASPKPVLEEKIKKLLE